MGTAPICLNSALARHSASVILPGPFEMNLQAALIPWECRNLRRPWLTLVLASTLSLACWPTLTRAENLKTESRMPFLHHIPLRDAEGQIITPPAAFDEQGKPQEARANPYSTAQTCGKCHE